ncbi:MAG: hypothetical protein Alpg2KO_32220 [Alphaproteobacteria bacterium]
MVQRLYHYSDQLGIERFDPRPDAQGQPLVWAIAESHRQNYLLPRDCPRICIHARPDTSAQDRDQFLQGAEWRIIVETGWMDRIAQSHLYSYRFSPDDFALKDPIAGYYTSTVPQLPVKTDQITDLPAAIAQTGTQLNHLPRLHNLAEQVAASSLGFSIIRMRNAAD